MPNNVEDGYIIASKDNFKRYLHSIMWCKRKAIEYADCGNWQMAAQYCQDAITDASNAIDIAKALEKQKSS